jgi:hypothetical protein
METQVPQPTIDISKVSYHKDVNTILKGVPSVLFVGFCSTGGGHTDREFNVVRSIIDRSFNKKGTDEQQKNAKKCLDKGSAVIVVLPPEWPVSEGMYFANAHAFIQELRKPELGLHIVVYRGTKSATSLYEKQGGRPAILRRHARFPFDDTPPQWITFDIDEKTQRTSNEKLVQNLAGKQGDDFKKVFREFLNTCQKISMMHLVPQVAAACGDVKKIWCSTDMDFALTRAMHKIGALANQVVDHESILNLFVENPYAGQSLLEYCYMGKVLPSDVAYKDGQPVKDPSDPSGKKLMYLSKTAHISLSTPDIAGLNQPNTLLQLRSMVTALVNKPGGDVYTKTRTVGGKGVKDGGEELRDFAWSVIQQAGVQLPAETLLKPNISTIGGFVYGKGGPTDPKLSGLHLDQVKGFVYLYLSDATSVVAKHIYDQLHKGNTGYENIVFAICAGGAFNAAHLPAAASDIPQKTNTMMYCNLMGADAVMQAGMGTSSEFAYSVVNGCRDAKLLVWPMEGQDEHASNARFVNGLFPSNVTQIGALNFVKALDDLVNYRNAKQPLQSYGVEYVRGILSDYTIAETAADVLLDDEPLMEQVEAALLNVSEPRLRVTYRLMKICVQMLDQLEGPEKVLKTNIPGAKSEDGEWPYTTVLDNGTKGKFVIALKRGDKARRFFKTTDEAHTFFSTPALIAQFLEVDEKVLETVYKETKVADRVLEALQPGDQLVSGFARYALKDISDIVKSGV